jgi:hypothetical protein
MFSIGLLITFLLGVANSQATSKKKVVPVKVLTANAKKWCEDLEDPEKPTPFFGRYAKQISTIYKLPHVNHEVSL